MQIDAFKLERTREALAQTGLEGALFTDYYNVSFLTGYTIFLENGPSPFTRGAAAALLLPGEIHLIADIAAGAEQADGWTELTTPYAGYSATGGITGVEAFTAAALTMLQERLPSKGRLGIELEHLPAALYAPLQERRANTWVPLPSSLMLGVRAVKSDAELERIRAAGKLAEVGQEAVRALVSQPGLSEIEVYNGAKRAIEVEAGKRVALQNALHGGVRSAHPVPGMPTGEILQAGDLIISDMVPCLDGYWADSCSTFAVGRVVVDQAQAIHAIAREAFERGFAAIRPGLTGDELANIVQGVVRHHGYDYWHHTGHGVGVSNHEEPRITPGSPTVLEPNMVVLLEPGVYVEDFGGCRQERMIRVTQDGAELMTHNPLTLV